MIGSRVCQILGYSHTLINCSVPEGQGKSLELNLSVSEQSVAVPFSYQAPNITTIENFQGKFETTTSGGLLTIVGSNFGVNNTVFLIPHTRPENKVILPQRVSNHTHIVCLVPSDNGADMGQDRDRVLQLRVDTPYGYEHDQTTSQTYEFGQKFRYMGPMIEEIIGYTSENPLPTHGRNLDFPPGCETECCDSLLLTITGQSFGEPITSESSSGDKLVKTAEVRLLQKGYHTRTADKSCNGIKVDGCSRCTVVQQSHRKIICNPGAGVGDDIRVVVAMNSGDHQKCTTASACQQSSPEEHTKISYLPPGLKALNARPTNRINALGGEVITITGSDFGWVASEVTIHFGGMNCTDATWRSPWLEDDTAGQCPPEYVHTSSIYHAPYLTCKTPVGMTVGKKNLTITVSQQTSAFPAVFPADDIDYKIVTECKAGYYGQLNERCAACPDGAVCETNNIGTPAAQKGFWQLEVPANHEKCQHPTREYTCPYFVACEPKSACTGENQCSAAYTGERCSQCAPGYFKLSGQCTECPECAVCTALLFLGAGAIAAIVSYILTRKRINLAILAIGIDYFQILAILAMSNQVVWPPQIKELFNLLSVFNVNLDLLAPECYTPDMKFEYKWLAIEFLPILFCGCFGIVHVFIYWHKRVIQKRTKNLHNHVHLVIGMCLMGFYYMYLYITKTSLDIFNCSQTDPPDDWTPGYMEVAFEPCYKPGGVHVRLLPFAIAFFLLYSVGYPVLVAFIILTNVEKIKADQLLRARETGDSKATNPSAWEFRKRYAKLYYMFKPHHFYWILLILARKFLIAVTGLMFRRTPVFLLAFSLVILFCCYALQVRHQPYMSMSERKKVVAVWELEQAGKDKMKFKETSAQKKRTRKVFKLGDGSSTDHLKHNRAVLYFWNYNAVEATLLFCACMVMLAGLMFQSKQVKEDPYWELGLASLTLVIIIFSIIYFFAVLLTEVLLGLGLLDRFAALQARVKKRSDKYKRRYEKQAEPEIEGVDSASATVLNKTMATKRLSTFNEVGNELETQLKHTESTIEALQNELRELKMKARSSTLTRFQSKSKKSARGLKKDASRKNIPGKKSDQIPRPQGVQPVLTTVTGANETVTSGQV